MYTLAWGVGKANTFFTLKWVTWHYVQNMACFLWSDEETELYSQIKNVCKIIAENDLQVCHKGFDFPIPIFAIKMAGFVVIFEMITKYKTKKSHACKKRRLNWVYCEKGLHRSYMSQIGKSRKTGGTALCYYNAHHITLSPLIHHSHSYCGRYNRNYSDKTWRAVIMFNWNDFCERRKPSFNRIISLSRNRRPFPIVFCQLKKK